MLSQSKLKKLVVLFLSLCAITLLSVTYLSAKGGGVAAAVKTTAMAARAVKVEMAASRPADKKAKAEMAAGWRSRRWRRQ